MLLTTGDRLGPYAVVAPLGVGGMGEVYRATDTNLKRQVAIKVLPASVAADAERLARFQREAEVLAALNHPNIAHIYGLEGGKLVGQAGTPAFLVMELVDGEDLSQRIARGPIPLDEALPIAKQIAEALEAAHDQGIIHRDLKPANIKVRPDGMVKVLDFGLAKAIEGADEAGRAGGTGRDALTQSPTLTTPAHLREGYGGRAMTQAGMILGTAAYMSPEQAAGKPVDKRSDLWAFGVVLLEMLTGRQVFGGETVSHVLASVLKDAPDWTTLPADTPAPIRKLLRRCLEKDRRKRVADAADVRLEIEDALTPPAAEPSSSSPALPPVEPLPPPRSWKRRAPMLAGFAAGAVLVGAAAMLMGTRSEGPVARALTYTPLSFEPGGNRNAVWSPDGKGVAFAARERDDEPYQVYVRYLDSSTSTPLTHMDSSATLLGWTTAGRIVFASLATPAGLWSISQTGGEAQPLLGITDARTANSAGVSPDGSALAYYGQQDGKYGVWISAPFGSPAKRYAPAPFEANANANNPTVRFSPDGQQLLLVRDATRGNEVWLMLFPANASHPPRRIFEKTMPPSTSTPRASWMPDNRRVVIAITSGSEPNRLYVADTVSGEFSLLSSGTTAETAPAVSPDGTRLAFTESSTDYDVLQVDLRTGDVSPLLATGRREDMPAWALKSAVMAYWTDRTGQPEIWLHQPGRPDRPVVTGRDFPPGTTENFMSPMVSPDGARIIYLRIARDGASLMWLSAVSGGAPVRVTNGELQHRERPGAWSPDGAWFAYWDTVPTATSVNRVRTTGQATPEVLVPKIASGTPGNAVPAWSPTGEWILQINNGWRLLSPDGKTEHDLELKADVCAFSRDAVQLYCVRPAGLGAVLFSRLVSGGQERIIATLAPNQVPVTGWNPSLRMTLTPDGQHLTFSAAKTENNLWLLGGIGPAR